jgi:hypothetical protein
MKALTVNQLYMLCRDQIQKGRGDYKIMISDDDEGNGYHYLWYAFQTVKEYEEPLNDGEFDFKLDFCWTSDNVSNKDNTIILG